MGYHQVHSRCTHSLQVKMIDFAIFIQLLSWWIDFIKCRLLCALPYTIQKRSSKHWLLIISWRQVKVKTSAALPHMTNLRGAHFSMGDLTTKAKPALPTCAGLDSQGAKRSRCKASWGVWSAPVTMSGWQVNRPFHTYMDMSGKSSLHQPLFTIVSYQLLKNNMQKASGMGMVLPTERIVTTAWSFQVTVWDMSTLGSLQCMPVSNSWQTLWPQISTCGRGVFEHMHFLDERLWLEEWISGHNLVCPIYPKSVPAAKLEASNFQMLWAPTWNRR